MINIRKLESELWESADELRANSKLTSNQYCMPVLGLIFLKYAHVRFKAVEAAILENRPMRKGFTLPVEPDDFIERNAMFLPETARYEYLLNLPASTDIGAAVNLAMEEIEKTTPGLAGVLPKTYTDFSNELLQSLLRIFNNSTLEKVGGDVIGRIYEYFLSKFAPAVASDDGVFFTPKSLVQMIVNVLEPKRGVLLDPACGSGGMFVQTGDFVGKTGVSPSSLMTFYGQEKVDYNAKLCLMNMAVHGLSGNIASGNDANTFYNDFHNLAGRCDYVMANPPFNVDKVNAESAKNAGRVPFGMPSENKSKEVSNANYLWISYFYSYLNDKGRAGFVMSSSATDSNSKEDKKIREGLVKADVVDVIISVSNNFFYTKSLPCNLWFFDKGKNEEAKGKTLFIDARKYFRVVDRTLNDWSEWQLKNLNALVWLYRGETEKYRTLLNEYERYLHDTVMGLYNRQWTLDNELLAHCVLDGEPKPFYTADDGGEILTYMEENSSDFEKRVNETLNMGKSMVKKEADAYAELITASRVKGKILSWKLFSKVLTEESDTLLADYSEAIAAAKELVWLYEKFGEGVYQDVAGLCKIATAEEIAERKFTLSPGMYVGVLPIKFEEQEVFSARMKEIQAELSDLQKESNELMKKIEANFGDLGI